MSRIRADKFVNNAANGAPQLTFGAEVVYGVFGDNIVFVSKVVPSCCVISIVGASPTLTVNIFSAITTPAFVVTLTQLLL